MATLKQENISTAKIGVRKGDGLLKEGTARV